MSIGTVRASPAIVAAIKGGTMVVRMRVRKGSVVVMIKYRQIEATKRASSARKTMVAIVVR